MLTLAAAAAAVEPRWQPVERAAGEYQFTALAGPAHVQASVLVCNPQPSCSATMIARGPNWAYGLSAGHCFAGRLGGKFWIYFSDGRASEAELIAHERSPDLALFRVAARDAKTVAPVPDRLAGSRLDAVGYPKGRGPRYKQLSWVRKSGDDWVFDVARGIFDAGDSGGGVFLDGQLIAVIWGKSSNQMRATPHHAIRQFLKRHQRLVETAAIAGTEFG